MKRTLDVLRITTANWPAAVAWPWGILTSAFVINLAIFSVLPEPDDVDGNFTGGLLSIYVTVGIFFLQLAALQLPFLLGLGVTRKRVLVAAALAAVAQGLVYGVALTGLQAIEAATGGWGLDLFFFGIPFLVVDNPVLQTLVYAGPFLAFATLGLLVGSCFLRWKETGVWALVLGSLIAAGAAVYLITWQGWWGTVGSWFADSSVPALFVGWPALFAAALGAASFTIVRRTAV